MNDEAQRIAAEFAELVELLAGLADQMHDGNSVASLWRSVFRLRIATRRLTGQIASEAFGVTLTDQEISSLSPESIKELFLKSQNIDVE